MITIEKVEIEGFGSIIEPLKYKFNRPGLDIIKGRVGSGKTSIIDALLWGLYGVRTKEKSSVAPWPWVAGKTSTGTKVEVTFYKDGKKIKVVRCQGYKGEVKKRKGANNLYLLISGVFQDGLRDKKDVQAKINELLGYSVDLFKSAVLFGQKVNRFMEESGTKRKKIMEEAFEVAYIGKAQKIAEERYKELTNRNNLAIQKLDLLQDNHLGLMDSIDQLKTQIEKAADQNKNTIKGLREQIKSLEPSKVEITQINKQIDTLTLSIKGTQEIIDTWPKLETLNPLRDKIFRAELALQAHVGKVDDTKAIMEKLSTDFVAVPHTCRECSRPFDPNDVKNQKAVIKEKLGEARKTLKELQLLSPTLKGKFEQLQEQYSSKQQELNGVDSHRATLYKLERERDKLALRLKGYQQNQKQVNNLKAQIQSIKDAPAIKVPPKMYDKKAKLETSIKLYTEKVSALKSKLDLTFWAIKGPLSNAGLKSYIFDTMLEDLNRALEKYTQILGYQVVMGIKMDSAYKDFEVTLLKGDEEIPSHDLSGGQKQLTNLAIALACHRVITKNKEINILILDECFEGLGDEEIDIVGDLIRQLTMGKSLHLITHRAFTPVNSYITELRLVKGKTELHTKLENN